MKAFSDRSAHLRQSDIRAVTALVNKHNGINLGQGICDLPTPDPIQAGAIDAITANKSIYSPYAGLPAVREKLMRKFIRHNGLPVTTPDQVMVTNGSTGGFVAATFALLNPGDEVLVFEPFYGYHNNLLMLAGAVLKPVKMQGAAWEIPFETLEAAVSEHTKMIVVNTPVNPCGKVWTEEELAALIRFAERHDLWIITDEVYEYMVFDGKKHISPASLPGGWDRTITLTSFSKTFNMTGWRMGAACAPAHIIERMGLIADLVYICAPTPLQYGLSAGLDVPDSYYADLSRDYQARRDQFCDTLDRCGFETVRPNGAYYAFTSFEKLARNRAGFSDGMEAVRTLIQEAGVAAVPGHSFFSNPNDGRYYLRFCFAKEQPVLDKACYQLEAAFGKQ
jgi:aminotransferase